MQDLFSVPSCFSSGEQLPENSATTTATRSGKSTVTLVYRTEISAISRLIMVTWCKNLLTHGLSVSIEGSEGDGKDKDGVGQSEANSGNSTKNRSACKVEMQPWHFWRKCGAKRFHVDGKAIDVFWDLRNARYSDEPEPLADYYVAVVSDKEVVLLVGDLKKDAFRRTNSRPSLQDAILVCKKEHVFGKKRFSTKAKFQEKGKVHDIIVECNTCNLNLNTNKDVEMVVKIDGSASVHVRHLQWKFRGNHSISIDNLSLQLYWDAHDWLFGSGLRNALFIFKQEALSSASPLASESNGDGDEHSDFCLFMYAWKLE